MKKSAQLSKCRNYRYALWRVWDEELPLVMFVGLNPSTADERLEDPTLIRCMNYAKTWGFGGVCMANLFAYRATVPKQLFVVDNPIGRYNDSWLKRLAMRADRIIAAWGNDGAFLGRGDVVRKFLPELYCLKINKSGQPAHPLYQRADVKPSRMPS